MSTKSGQDHISTRTGLNVKRPLSAGLFRQRPMIELSGKAEIRN